MLTVYWVILFVVVAMVLSYQRATWPVWCTGLFVYLLLLSGLGHFAIVSQIIIWVVFLIFITFLAIKPLRRKLLTHYIFARYHHVVPKLSKTEKEAITVGTVNWEGELFSGMPNWDTMLKNKPFSLSEEEQAFLAGPVEKLCCMIDDWEITHKLADLPKEMWQFLKENGFFGMIIPKRYGGKEFSAAAHSAVLVKVGACSVTVSSTIAVPNSLGPAELLLKYGTEEQKSYYLPRLAIGEELPCFALTGPEAGSDASAIPDTGIVCRGQFEGKEVIGIRLNFNKRYITLAPVASVIGLAFKLFDPEHLLGTKDAIGITCALIPRATPGITIGRRHFPLNVPFQNGPILGKDVFIPLTWIIGGPEMAGHGWTMLVECLSVGRGITLPAMTAGGAKAAAVMCGAYTQIREQFGLPIAHFGGVEEALTRIAANAYVIDAARQMTVATIDRGEQPAVATAIIKYHATTRGRLVTMDAMDIHGGKGICLGPRNYFGRAYQSAPISITVEGANILTRCMIIFGQGALRCHPYLLAELNAAYETDTKKGLADFDEAFTSHAGFIISNMVRSLVLGLTGAHIVLAPKSKVRNFYQQFTRFSSAFAFLSDIAFITFGGGLKRKEKISARLGDVLSLLYLGSAVLKHFHEQGEPDEELPLVEWACQDILFTIQNQMDGVLNNFSQRWVAGLVGLVIFPLGRNFCPPDDKLGHKVASILMFPNSVRDRFAQGLCLDENAPFPLGRMEKVFKQVLAVEEIEKKVRKAAHDGLIKATSFALLIDEAETNAIITASEAQELRNAHAARMEIIAVDDFDAKELGHHF